VIKYNLGLVYESLHDSRKAAEYLQKAMGLGQISIPQDLDTRIKALGSAAIPADIPLDSLRTRAAAGDIAARIALANRLFKLGAEGEDEALELMRQAAEEGNPGFQENYARNLLVLRGRKAAEEAVKFFRMAASQGNPEAQYELGLLLYEGKIIQKDEVQASQWMHLAAQRGDQNAQSVLKEMKLFLDSAAFEEGKKRAENFKPIAPAAGNQLSPSAPWILALIRTTYSECGLGSLALLVSALGLPRRNWPC
jgi:TPR repeat protein